MKIINKTLLLAAIAISIAAPAFSLTAEEIAIEYEKNSTFDTSITDATLIIEDNLGTSTQTLRSYENGEGDTLIEITGGPDRGQKVLRKDQSIYLYYPDADQVIRLQGSSLKESFMGSDFSYEDLSSDSSILKNYDVEITDETDDSYTLFLTAKNRSMTYQKQELVVDKTNFYLMSAVLKSASGRDLRSLVNSDFVEIKGHYVAKKSVMKDLIKKQGSTTMKIDDIQINTDINPRLFSKDNLSW